MTIQDPLRTTKPPVIQITGLSPCSGKTQLLYKIASQALLLTSGQSTARFGGAVIWIDNNNRFSIERLHCILRTQSSSRLSEDQSVSDLVKASLRNLHVFRPQSSDAFLATVRNLIPYLLDPKAHPSSGYPVKALVIDNVSSFFWEDRWEKEKQNYRPQGNTTAPEISDYTQRWRTLVAYLSELQSMFGCTVAVSNVCLFSASVFNSRPALRTNVPNLWSDFVTLELIVAKNPPLRFRRGLSVEEAHSEARYGDKDLRKGICTGWLGRLVSAEQDPFPSILESVGDSRFTFKIDENDVIPYG